MSFFCYSVIGDVSTSTAPERQTMELYPFIFKRKSCREFTDEPLSVTEIDAMHEAIRGFMPLYPDVPLSYRIVTKASGLFAVKAPHYLIVSGEGDARDLESCGFLFQQLMLWLNAHEIGSVWLGVAKEKRHARQRHDLITIAFGKPKGSIRRDESAFIRKPMAEITNDPHDRCIQAARLAPSGLNLQPWYWEKEQGRVLLYKQKLRFPYSLVYTKRHVDLGIALCHYALAMKEEGSSFHCERFDKKNEGPKKKGYRLFAGLSSMV